MKKERTFSAFRGITVNVVHSFATHTTASIIGKSNVVLKVITPVF
jgi:hypothetical protein